jgi:hypothetical protein
LDYRLHFFLQQLSTAAGNDKIVSVSDQVYLVFLSEKSGRPELLLQSLFQPIQGQVSHYR